MKNHKGFTLVEILIALFIFTILSFMLASGLRTVIHVQSGTEEKAEQLRQLQMALLILSRDIEQVVDRPIVNANGKEEEAFVGSSTRFSLTHAGVASFPGGLAQGGLQRAEYEWHENHLQRSIWPVLDQVENKKQIRQLLDHVTGISFQYLDQEKHFSDKWPMNHEEMKQPLPRGVKIELTLSHWGKITQLFLIPAQKAII